MRREAQRWNVQVRVTPVILKLIKDNVLDGWQLAITDLK